MFHRKKIAKPYCRLTVLKGEVLSEKKKRKDNSLVYRSRK